MSRTYEQLLFSYAENVREAHSDHTFSATPVSEAPVALADSVGNDAFTTQTAYSTFLRSPDDLCHQLPDLQAFISENGLKTMGYLDHDMFRVMVLALPPLIRKLFLETFNNHSRLVHTYFFRSLHQWRFQRYPYSSIDDERNRRSMLPQLAEFIELVECWALPYLSGILFSLDQLGYLKNGTARIDTPSIDIAPLSVARLEERVAVPRCDAAEGRFLPGQTYSRLDFTTGNSEIVPVYRLIVVDEQMRLVGIVKDRRVVSMMMLNTCHAEIGLIPAGLLLEADSKDLGQTEREQLFSLVSKHNPGYSVAVVTIDELARHFTFAASRSMAVTGLDNPPPTFEELKSSIEQEFASTF